MKLTLKSCWEEDDSISFELIEDMLHIVSLEKKAKSFGMLKSFSNEVCTSLLPARNIRLLLKALRAPDPLPGFIGLTGALPSPLCIKWQPDDTCVRIGRWEPSGKKVWQSVWLSLSSIEQLRGFLESLVVEEKAPTPVFGL